MESTPTARLLRKSLAALTLVSGGVVLAQNGDPRLLRMQGGADLLARVEVKPVSKEQLTKLVQRLGSDDWATREAASRELSSSSITLPLIEEMLRTQDLSSEQKQRLQAAGFSSFMQSDRGALGVSFDARQMPDGIGIGRCEPGFHSSEVLRAGDVIRAIDGHAVNDVWNVRPNIITKDPGETVELDVLRDGELLQVTLKLGSFRMLRGNAGIDASTMQLAWDKRLERVRGEAARGLVRVPALTAGQEAGEPVMVSYRGGGDVLTDENEVEVKEGEVMALAGGRHGRVSRSALEYFRQSPENAEEFDAIVKQLQNQLQLWETQQRKLEARLADPAMKDDERARIKQRIESIENSKRETMRQIKKVEQANAVEKPEQP